MKNHPAFRLALLAGGLLLCITGSNRAVDAAENWPGQRAEWNGFEQVKFKVDGASAYVVFPEKSLPGNPWIWRARFPGYHAEMDQQLIRDGFHVGYIDVAGLFGSLTALTRGEKFYEYVTSRGLNKRPTMEGVSRGGLFVYNWTVKYPNRVSCIYCDTPVLDFKSWPAGRGTGKGHAPTWQACMKSYGMTAEQALSYTGNPVDAAKKIAAAKVPILHVVSENDQVVPPAENTDLLAKRLKAEGVEMQIIRVPQGTAKSLGHHFTHPEPDRVVEFIKRHGS